MGPPPVSWLTSHTMTWILSTSLSSDLHTSITHSRCGTSVPSAPPSLLPLPVAWFLSHFPHPFSPSATPASSNFKTHPEPTTSHYLLSCYQVPTTISHHHDCFKTLRSLWSLLCPLQNGFYAASRMVLLNANHFMSLFCSKPFIGFLHIQSKTFLKCWKDLAPTIALSFFFFFFFLPPPCSLPESPPTLVSTPFPTSPSETWWCPYCLPNTPGRALPPQDLLICSSLGPVPSLRQQQSSTLDFTPVSASGPFLWDTVSHHRK